MNKLQKNYIQQKKVMKSRNCKQIMEVVDQATAVAIVMKRNVKLLIKTAVVKKVEPVVVKIRLIILLTIVIMIIVVDKKNLHVVKMIQFKINLAKIQLKIAMAIVFAHQKKPNKKLNH